MEGSTMGSKEQPQPNQKNLLTKAGDFIADKLESRQPHQLATAGGPNIPADLNARVKDRKGIDGRKGAAVAPKPDIAPQKTLTGIAEEAEEYLKKEAKKRKSKKPSKIGKKTRIALAGLAAVGAVETTGAVFNEQINKKPLSISTIGEDVMWSVNILTDLLNPKVIPSTFNPDSDMGIVKAGVNATSVASTEILRNAYLEQVTQNNDGHPTIVFPATFTTDGKIINYEYQQPLLVGTDSKTGEPVYLDRPGTIRVHFDVGEEIIIPAENSEVFQFPPQIIGGKEYFVGLWIKFQQNGETYAFGISAADVRTFTAIGEAINAPKVPVNKGGTLLLNEAKDGLKLSLGTPVARVNINTDPNLGFTGFSLSRFNPETQRWESIRPNFVTDGPDGQKKLLVGK